MTFREELELAINRTSQETGSNTPDWVLAHFLEDCLRAFDAAVKDRESWYGRKVTSLLAQQNQIGE